MNRNIAAHPSTERGALCASVGQIRELATAYLALLARVEREITSHSDAIRAGMEDARRKGKHVGRPLVDIDMEHVGRLWAEGYGLKAIARETGYDRNTIRRRLLAAGMLPGDR